MIRKKIKVLIVDDSLVFREFLARSLAADPGIEVVATAVDAYDARDKIIEFEPDVMTLDVEMPRMSGVEFLQRLLPQYPLPVVMISAISDKVFEAMAAGAVDFVVKPDPKGGRAPAVVINELKTKIKVASIAKVAQCKKPALPAQPAAKPVQAGSSDRIIALGASTGGTEAIFSILKKLPADMPGMVIVQHMPPVFTRLFAERMNALTLLDVKEAQSGDRLGRGRVLIAPGDKHMRLVKVSGGFGVECAAGDKVSGHCPSVDVLFESVAREAGKNAIGVLLTGMGQDGAKGLLKMRQGGARTIGQDEQTSVVYGMPKVAWELGAVEKQGALSAIPQLIYSFLP
ncbi:protein-glutamate methylesterase/protein-glutamine glutaminase [Sporomusa acidovorans]|uniref:Protein-glutamate methylesterase/protein-glutamine glutaminase n=1 Tax=Sporomusa acidovorans (strain ATCC 49682 / DSM 3132 / Mol) TaxID=1123286 RepID=A0ABZ3J8G5_SPOA4|nr:chemotaxis response regulator protein-glutamate methylesterase [Sporomusa acidovorans]OZC16636.1 chemotaxis response regulator protein-glutamate methylesterase [Sporomusa acidovorans DSM 3132]SDE07570.1 two-component system, chemotaxis family, response regulator CheB [Sporomusa acidovorans]